jgi:hypothetical protein
MTDQATFDRVFGRSDWAVMFILADEGQSYARLRFNVGPGAEIEIPVGVDYTRPFGRCDADAWEQEYLTNVQPQTTIHTMSPVLEPVLAPPFYEEPSSEWYESWFDYAQDDDNVKGFVS